MTPTPAPHEHGNILWNVGHGDREYARETGDPVLGHVIATTRAEAIQKAHADQWATIPKGTLYAPAGFWAWPVSAAPPIEIVNIMADARATMERSGARLIGTFRSWKEYNDGTWTFDTGQPACHVTEDADGIHFWVFDDEEQNRPHPPACFP